ncbi:SRPBCC family protein [Chloroflexi bacterium CFX2]|nr:SRPBCC family protein [Chloroflexi bacterium CFX2]
MAKIERTIAINAPVEKVYEYLTTPMNLLEIWPSMVEIKDIQNPGVVGGGFHWVYKMAGMKLEGATEYSEVIPCQRFVARNTGGISSTLVWLYQPENGGTRLTLQAEYTVPLPLVGKLAEAFIVKQNEHEMDTLFANLKARMEE